MQPGNKRWGDYLFQKQGRWWVHLILLPLLIISWLYGLIVWARLKLYQKGLLKTKQLPCKVISVGNTTLGGTGKTPMVAYLAREFQKSGVKVGIASRGYKGLMEKRGGVLSDGEDIYLSPAEAGDEPFMLAKMLSGVPLLVGKNRYDMGLYGYEKFGLDVLILDDGFQHLGLKRDLDIVLIDARNGFGNEHLFPRGPLREPLRGLRRASLFVLGKGESSPLLEEIEGVLRDVAPGVPLYHSRYKPVYFLEAASGKMFSPEHVRARRILVFAGVVDPAYFSHLLKVLGAEVVKEIHFPDHHRYTPEDLAMLGGFAGEVEVFVTTEKDFVKLQQIPLSDFPLFVLGITQEILEEEAFRDRVFSVIAS